MKLELGYLTSKYLMILLLMTKFSLTLCELDGMFIVIDCTVFFFNKFYFRNANQLVALVQPAHEKHSTLAIKARPSHCWINNETLAIGWYDTVSICVIISSSNSQVNYFKFRNVFLFRRLFIFSSFHGYLFKALSSTGKKEVEVHYVWKLDMYIADISFTLSDDKTCSWKEITVFGIKNTAVQDVNLFF